MPRRPLTPPTAAPTPTEPERARGAGVRLRGVADGVAWTVYDHRDGGGELAWYDAARKRRKARIPPSVASDAALRAYAASTIRVVADESKRAADAAPVRPERPTFGSVAAQWTSGELARRHPDHVARKASVGDDVQRLRDHVLDHCGGIALADFTIDDADRVMAKLGAHLSPETRRKVGQLVHRVLDLAVFPLRIIPSNPLPSNWLPKPSKPPVFGFLYPSEDARLLAHKPTPLHLRLLFGFLAREGCRASEACGLRWSDLDLAHGAVTLDENKTDDARTWKLDPAVIAALRIWREIAPKPTAKRGTLSEADAADWYVFVDAKGRNLEPENLKLADDLRDALRAAGVERHQLFERNDQRAPLRCHDLRATFVTVSTAIGHTEAWITDRTGHKSSEMVNRYRRAARSLVELNLARLSQNGAASRGWRRLAQLIS